VPVDERAVGRPEIGDVRAAVVHPDDRVISADLVVVQHDAEIDAADDGVLVQVEARPRRAAAEDDESQAHRHRSYRATGAKSAVAVATYTGI
jgi:hypothetical protein